MKFMKRHSKNVVEEGQIVEKGKFNIIVLRLRLILLILISTKIMNWKRNFMKIRLIKE